MISDVRRADLIDQLAEVALDVGPMLDDASWLDQLTDRVHRGPPRLRRRRRVGGPRRARPPPLRGRRRAAAPTSSSAPSCRSARGLAGYVAVSGQALAIDEPASDPRFARDVAERTGYVPQTLLLVPDRRPDGIGRRCDHACSTGP